MGELDDTLVLDSIVDGVLRELFVSPVLRLSKDPQTKMF